MTRDVSIDMAKGIAIILMVAGHTEFLFPWGSLGSKAIFAFHMPLFFIFSGYFIKDSDFKVKKEFQHLILPYMLFSLLRILLVECLSLAKGDGMSWDCVIGALYGAGSTKHFLGITTPMNSPLWFLLALFVSKFVFQRVILRVNENVQVFVLFGLVVIGWTIGKFVWLPFSICPAMVGLFYLYCGHHLRINGRIVLLSNNNFVVLLSLLVWVSCAFLSPYSLESATLPYYTFSLMAPCFITTVIYSLCNNLQNDYSKVKQTLSWCGRVSMAVLCVHSLEMIINPMGRFYKLLSEIWNWGGFLWY